MPFDYTPPNPTNRARVVSWNIVHQPEAGGSIQYDVGYDDAGNFVQTSTHRVNISKSQAIALIADIQATTTVTEARNAVEAFLEALIETPA